jgi:hypothetical protein
MTAGELHSLLVLGLTELSKQIQDLRSRYENPVPNASQPAPAYSPLPEYKSEQIDAPDDEKSSMLSNFQ